MFENPFGKNKKSKLEINVSDSIDRNCPRDYRATVKSIATDARGFIKEYLEVPNNGYTKDELSISITISGDSKTLYGLTVLQGRKTMSTDNIYLNSFTFNLAKGKYPVKVRIGVYVKNRTKNGSDRASHIYNQIERNLQKKHGKTSA